MAHMASLFDFSRNISKLKKEKNFTGALAYFKENKTAFSKDQIATNEYLVSDMLYCLRGANFFDAGNKFLAIYNVEIGSNTKERILTAYGWLLWSQYKFENSPAENFREVESYHFDDEDNEYYEQNDYQKPNLIVRIEQLIPLLYEKNTDFSRSVISNLFNIVLKSEKNKPSPNWHLVEDFCNHFHPNDLNTECSTIKVVRKGRQKDMELASDKENWYAYKTKALQKLNKWQECFDLSKEALSAIDRFHYSNDVWFSRRIALSKKNLGSSKESIEELQAILKKKKEWFIQKELAELYFDENDIERANTYALDAINNFGPLEFKIDLLFLMGKIFLAKGENDLALKHFSLSKLIRLSQDPPWKIPQKLIDELREIDEAEINMDKKRPLESELKIFWRSFSTVSKVPEKGVALKGFVKKILNSNERGKDGFITSEKNDYYFSIPATNLLLSKIEERTNVIFQIMPSRDGKKPQAKIIKIND